VGGVGGEGVTHSTASWLRAWLGPTGCLLQGNLLRRVSRGVGVSGGGGGRFEAWWWWWWSDLWGFHHAVLTSAVVSCLCVHVCVV